MDDGGVLVMAKKRKEAPKGKAPASVIVSVRVSAEFRDWLDALVDHERMKLSDIFDRAIVDYARKVGFSKVAPKR